MLTRVDADYCLDALQATKRAAETFCSTFTRGFVYPVPSFVPKACNSPRIFSACICLGPPTTPTGGPSSSSSSSSSIQSTAVPGSSSSRPSLPTSTGLASTSGVPLSNSLSTSGSPSTASSHSATTGPHSHGSGFLLLLPFADLRAAQLELDSAARLNFCIRDARVCQLCKYRHTASH